MINFNLATNRFFRKFVGFLTIGITVYLTIDKINTNLEVLLFLFGIVFSAYFVLEYSSYGSEEWITIDFRSEHQKEIDESSRKQKLLEAAKENLILEAAQGNIGRSEIERRLDSILFIEKQLNTPLLQSPIENDYV